ncbi:hypothetical protein [Streptomyces sp. B6B3]|uniref:hypothetical protein n=1 Tax=Streptomyces sp. B6B3 TaxID=3153570 RepID=UPI00325DEDD4
MTGPGTAEPEPVRVLVSVAPGRFDEVVAAARRAGLTIVAEHAIIGSLTGTIREQQIPVLESLDGVLAVDRERIVRLPPNEGL